MISDETDSNLAGYLRVAKSEEIYDMKNKIENGENKIITQQSNPLYDDIHQIAGDLRFIKNLIVIGLVCGVVMWIIGVLGML